MARYIGDLLGTLKTTFSIGSILMETSGINIDFKSTTSSGYTRLNGEYFTFRDNSSGLGISMKAPNLSGGYTITLADALPGATSILRMSTSGVISYQAESLFFHNNQQSEFYQLTVKSDALGDPDLFIIEDYDNSYQKRKVLWSNIKSSLLTYFNTAYATLSHTHVETDITDLDHTDANAIHDNVAGEISLITAKTTPVDADVTVIEDSAASNAKKKLSWSNIKATLKTYMDTLYAPIAKGVTNGDSHDHSGGDGAQIDHTTLSNIGSNAHSAIDTHISSTSNPHQVDYADVSGQDAGTDVTAAELEELTDGSTTSLHDHSGITDADAIHDNVSGEISAITAKTTPVDADITLIEDSAASNAKKKLSWSNIKATMKAYMDTIYAPIAKGVTNGDSHDHSGGDGAQINHTTLSNIGSNSHSTIDTHISSTSNPHQVDYADVSGQDAGTDVTAAELEELTDGSSTTLHSHSSITDSDAIHDNVAGEINAITAKTSADNSDAFVLEDSGASYAKKKMTWLTIRNEMSTFFSSLFVAANVLIPDGTKTKITYDSKGLVTAGADATIEDIDINGATDIAAALVDADEFGVYDSSATANRKSAISRIWTYIQGKINAWTGGIYITSLDIDGGTDIGAGLADADLIIVDDGAGGTNRKSAMSRVWTYIKAKLQAATDIVITILDINGGTEIGGALVDNDYLIVYDTSVGTVRKSLLNRVYNYLLLQFQYYGWLYPSSQTITTSDFSSSVGFHYRLTIGGMTANRNFDLPTPATTGQRVGLTVLDGDDAYELVIRANSVEITRVFIAGESLVLLSTGTGAGDWIIAEDGRIPCIGSLEKTNAQTISTGSDTQIQFNTQNFDRGDFMSTSTYDATVRRNGKYRAIAKVSFASMADGDRIRVIPTVNDSTDDYDQKFGGSGGNQVCRCVSEWNLNVGDTIECYGNHNHGTDLDTATVTGQTCKLIVEELL